MNNKNISYKAEDLFIDTIVTFTAINPALICAKELNQTKVHLIAELNTTKFENYKILSDTLGIKLSEVKKNLKQLVEMGLLTEFYRVKPREVLNLIKK
jgi:DNA-binding MarR family transcriptional regulator